MTAIPGHVSGIEGLRGILSLCILISQISSRYFPAGNGLGGDTYQHFVDQLMYHSVFRVFFVGFPSVCVFFVISGFVLSREFLRTHNKRILFVASLKRYFRLMLPVLVASIILAVHSTIFAIKPSLSLLWTLLRNSVEDGVWTLFAYGHHDRCPSLWTMYYEFLCSIALFAFLAIVGTRDSKWLYASIISLIILNFGRANLLFFCLFLAGIFIDDLEDRFEKDSTAIISLVLALYVGGYDEDSAFHSPLRFIIAFLEESLSVSPYWSGLLPSVAAVVIVAVCLGNTRIYNVISSPFLLSLGESSLSLFLSQPIALNTVYRFLPFFSSKLGFPLASVFCSVLAFCSALFLSRYFNRFVITPCNIVVSKIDLFLKKKFTKGGVAEWKYMQ